MNCLPSAQRHHSKEMSARHWVARSHYGPCDIASGFAASDFGGPVFDGSGGDVAGAVPAGVMASRRRLSRLSRLRLAARRDSSMRCTSTCCGLFFAQLSRQQPRSSRLYQITSPSPSQKIALRARAKTAAASAACCNPRMAGSERDLSGPEAG